MPKVAEFICAIAQSSREEAEACAKRLAELGAWVEVRFAQDYADDYDGDDPHGHIAYDIIAYNFSVPESAIEQAAAQFRVEYCNLWDGDYGDRDYREMLDRHAYIAEWSHLPGPCGYKLFVNVGMGDKLCISQYGDYLKREHESKVVDCEVKNGR